MTPTLQILFFALAAAAPGDIYRCVTADGSVHFQGRPCEGEQLGAIRSSAVGSERRLREWLNELPPGAGPAEAASAPTALMPAADHYRTIELPARPTDQRALAQCSERFLHCAHGDGAAMDRCVAGIPSCSDPTAGACCHANFIDRYQVLREHGFDRKTAVRDALLGPL